MPLWGSCATLCGGEVTNEGGSLASTPSPYPQKFTSEGAMRFLNE
jgi:hypothetical protein